MRQVWGRGHCIAGKSSCCSKPRNAEVRGRDTCGRCGAVGGAVVHAGVGPWAVLRCWQDGTLRWLGSGHGKRYAAGLLRHARRLLSFM